MNCKEHHSTNLSIERYKILKLEKNSQEYIAVDDKIDGNGKDAKVNEKFVRYINSKVNYVNVSTLKNVRRNGSINNSILPIKKARTHGYVIKRSKESKNGVDMVDAVDVVDVEDEENFQCVSQNASLYVNKNSPYYRSKRVKLGRSIEGDNVKEEENARRNSRNKECRYMTVKVTDQYPACRRNSSGDISNKHNSCSLRIITKDCSPFEEKINPDMSNSVENIDMFIQNDKSVFCNDDGPTSDKTYCEKGGKYKNITGIDFANHIDKFARKEEEEEEEEEEKKNISLSGMRGDTFSSRDQVKRNDERNINVYEDILSNGGISPIDNLENGFNGMAKDNPKGERRINRSDGCDGYDEYRGDGNHLWGDNLEKDTQLEEIGKSIAKASQLRGEKTDKCVVQIRKCTEGLQESKTQDDCSNGNFICDTYNSINEMSNVGGEYFTHCEGLTKVESEKSYLMTTKMNSSAKDYDQTDVFIDSFHKMVIIKNGNFGGNTNSMVKCEQGTPPEETKKGNRSEIRNGDIVENRNGDVDENQNGDIDGNPSGGTDIDASCQMHLYSHEGKGAKLNNMLSQDLYKKLSQSLYKKLSQSLYKKITDDTTTESTNNTSCDFNESTNNNSCSPKSTKDMGNICNGEEEEEEANEKVRLLRYASNSAVNSLSLCMDYPSSLSDGSLCNNVDSKKFITVEEGNLANYPSITQGKKVYAVENCTDGLTYDRGGSGESGDSGDSVNIAGKESGKNKQGTFQGSSQGSCEKSTRSSSSSMRISQKNANKTVANGKGPKGGVKKTNLKRSSDGTYNSRENKKMRIDEYSIINLNILKNSQLDIYKDNSYNTYILQSLRNSYLQNKLNKRNVKMNEVKSLEGIVPNGYSKDILFPSNEKKYNYNKKRDNIRNVHDNVGKSNFVNMENNEVDDIYKGTKIIISQRKEQDMKDLHQCDNDGDIYEKENSRRHNSAEGVLTHIGNPIKEKLFQKSIKMTIKNNAYIPIQNKNQPLSNNIYGNNYQPKKEQKYDHPFEEKQYSSPHLNLSDIIKLLEKEKIENLYSEDELKCILFPICGVYYDGNKKKWICKYDDVSKLSNMKTKTFSTKTHSYHESRQLALELKYNNMKKKYNIFTNFSDEEKIFFISLNSFSNGGYSNGGQLKGDERRVTGVHIMRKEQHVERDEEEELMWERQSEIDLMPKRNHFSNGEVIRQVGIHSAEITSQQKEEKNEEHYCIFTPADFGSHTVLNNQSRGQNGSNWGETLNILNSEAIPNLSMSSPPGCASGNSSGESEILQNGKSYYSGSVAGISHPSSGTNSGTNGCNNSVIGSSSGAKVESSWEECTLGDNSPQNASLKTQSILYNTLGIALSDGVLDKMKNLQRENIFYEREKKRWVIRIFEKKSNTLLYFKHFDCKVFGFLYACILTIEHKHLYLDFFLNEKNYDFLMALIQNNYINRRMYYSAITQPDPFYNGITINKNSKFHFNNTSHRKEKMQTRVAQMKNGESHINGNLVYLDENGMVDVKLVRRNVLEENYKETNFEKKEKNIILCSRTLLHSDPDVLYNYQSENGKPKNRVDISPLKKNCVPDNFIRMNHNQEGDKTIFLSSHLEKELNENVNNTSVRIGNFYNDSDDYGNAHNSSDDDGNANNALDDDRNANNALDNDGNANNPLDDDGNANNPLDDDRNFLERTCVFKEEMNVSKMELFQCAEKLYEKETNGEKQPSNGGYTFNGDLHIQRNYNFSAGRKRDPFVINGGIHTYGRGYPIDHVLIHPLDHPLDYPHANDNTNDGRICNPNKLFTLGKTASSEQCKDLMISIKETNEKTKKRKKGKDGSFFRKSKGVKNLLPNAKDPNLASELAREEANSLITLDSYVDTLNNNSDVISIAKQTILLLLKDILKCIPFQMAPSVISRKIYDQKINAHVRFVYHCKNLIDLMPYFFIFKNIIKQRTLPSDQSLYICNVLLYALFEA
ncbi:conserved Plasmodium protein, unknown function [Plasmodium ovale]|uniref:AP2-coincident C-terminal domain-containing protein n=1 Tax=Plasmodium ovale TaxID=36330 RepID=A0A1D3U9K9_PLAOA|nr:conserved Plasmodium protein, unknown function [Plasmodium ovale]